MSDNLKIYNVYNRAVHALIANGLGDSHEADLLRDEMEPPWDAMTEEEQEQAGEYSNVCARRYDRLNLPQGVPEEVRRKVFTTRELGVKGLNGEPLVARKFEGFMDIDQRNIVLVHLSQIPGVPAREMMRHVQYLREKLPLEVGPENKVLLVAGDHVEIEVWEVGEEG